MASQKPIETPAPANDPDNVVSLGAHRRAKLDAQIRARRANSDVSPERVVLLAMAEALRASGRRRDRALLFGIRAELIRLEGRMGSSPGFEAARNLLD